MTGQRAAHPRAQSPSQGAARAARRLGRPERQHDHPARLRLRRDRELPAQALGPGRGPPLSAGQRVPGRLDPRQRPPHGTRARRRRRPSTRAHEIRGCLERNGIPHGFYAAEWRAGTAAPRPGRARRLPPAGRASCSTGTRSPSPPTPRSSTRSAPATRTSATCDLAIIAAGPAGLRRRLYAASEGLRTDRHRARGRSAGRRAPAR